MALGGQFSKASVDGRRFAGTRRAGHDQCAGGFVQELLGLPSCYLLIAAVILFVDWLVQDEKLWPFSILFCFISLAVFLWHGRRSALSKKLVARGSATRGVAVEDKGYHNEADSWDWLVAYETTTGSHLTLTLEIGHEELTVGDTLTILYLPEAPKRAMAYMDCYYTAVR